MTREASELRGFPGHGHPAGSATNGAGGMRILPPRGGVPDELLPPDARRLREAQRHVMDVLKGEPEVTLGALLTDGKLGTSHVIAALVDHKRLELLEWDDETNTGRIAVILER